MVIITSFSVFFAYTFMLLKAIELEMSDYCYPIFIFGIYGLIKKSILDLTFETLNKK